MAETDGASILPVSVKKYSSGEEDSWKDQLAKEQIEGWRAVAFPTVKPFPQRTLLSLSRPGGRDADAAAAPFRAALPDLTTRNPQPLLSALADGDSSVFDCRRAKSAEVS